MCRILCALVFMCFIKVGMAHNIPTYDIANTGSEREELKVGVFVDSNNNIGIDSLSKLHTLFEPVDSRYAIKSIKKTYWFAFQLTNSSLQKIEKIIGFDEVFLETVHIYYKSELGWYAAQSGLSVPVHEREIENRCPLFRIALNSKETKTIYLRAYSEFALIVGLVMDDPEVFRKKEQGRTMGYWAYFGAAMAILIYNLFLLLYIRERVYLYYVIYALCFVIFTFLYSGYAQYLTTHVKVLYGLDASIATMGAFITLFTRELLKTKQMTQWIDRVLLGISLIYASIAVLIVVDIYFYQWLVALSMPSMSFLLFTGIFAVFKNVRFAKYYVVAMSSYLIGLAMIGAVNMGLIPYNSITRYGFMIGSLIELVMFSLALGYRIKYLQDEKNTFQEQLILAERNQKKRLERLVKARTEELTSMNAKLRQLSQFKEDMTGMIIHDLKNPLSAIVGAKNIEDEGAKLNTIEQSSSKMLTLVQNILDVYKSQSNQLELNKTNLALDEIITGAINEVQSLAGQKSIKTIVNNRVSEKVEVDGSILKRVLVNILSNAIKASPGNGSIDMEISCDQGIVRMYISNQGPGIPKSEQKVIFEKYKQLKHTQNREYSSGLGLAFCKMAIEAHGGEIGVISESSRGATFWFSLPNAITECTSPETEMSNPNKKELPLAKTDKEYLAPFAQKVKTCEMFDIGKINRILDEITSESEAVKAWVNELEDSIYCGNTKAFNELLNL